MSLARGSLLLMAVLLAPSMGCDSQPVVANSANRHELPAAASTGPLETSFDDIKFEMEIDAPFDRSLLTPKVEELFGKRIRIRGYMYPTLKRKGLTAFVLVRDNLECCFGPGAALFDCIRVLMHPDKTAEYSIRPIAVEGTFKFEEFTDMDGTTRAIYLLEEAAVD